MLKPKLTTVILSVCKDNQLCLIYLKTMQYHLRNMKFESSFVMWFNSFTILMSVWSVCWKCWWIHGLLFHTRPGLNQLLNFLPIPIALQEFPALILPICLPDSCIISVFYNSSFQTKWNAFMASRKIANAFEAHSSFFFFPISCKNLNIWLMQLQPGLKPHQFSLTVLSRAGFDLLTIAFIRIFLSTGNKITPP